MYLIGDIGNTEIKVCLVDNNNKIFKKIIFSNRNISLSKLKFNLKKLDKYLSKV